MRWRRRRSPTFANTAGTSCACATGSTVTRRRDLRPTIRRRRPPTTRSSRTPSAPETFGHPEVILLGTWQHAHPFLNAVGDLVREGRRFAPGVTSDEVLDEFTVRFDPVSDSCRTELLTLADWAAGRKPFDALQLVLPDTSGRWPEDPDYNGFPQPPLADCEGPPERALGTASACRR